MSWQTPYHGAWNPTEFLGFETTEVTGKEYRECEVCKKLKAPYFWMHVGIGERVQTEQQFQKQYMDFLGKYPTSKKGPAWISQIRFL